MSDLSLYTLTHLTRGASAQRRVVIQGFDLPMRGLMIFGIGLLPALLVTMIAWIALGEYALVAIPLVEGGIFWLIESRTRDGLHLRKYQALLDQRKAQTDVFVMCGETFDPAGSQLRTVRSNTVTVDRPDASVRLGEIIDTGWARSRPPRKFSGKRMDRRAAMRVAEWNDGIPESADSTRPPANPSSIAAGPTVPAPEQSADGW